MIIKNIIKGKNTSLGIQLNKPKLQKLQNMQSTKSIA